MAKLYDIMLRSIPDCVPVDRLADKTPADLIHAATIQLDLINEGQDGTEWDDPQAIRAWLKKWPASTARAETADAAENEDRPVPRCGHLLPGGTYPCDRPLDHSGHCNGDSATK